MTSQSCVLSDLQKLSDKRLFELCQQYGKNSRMWRRKFEALIPEIEKRKLHKKKGFYSIYEFAAKLCGLTQNTVNEILRVHQKLANKPHLLKQLKEQGWAKTRVVATIATQETDDMWAEKVKTLPKSSLETYVQDWKKQKDKKEMTRRIEEINLNRSSPIPEKLATQQNSAQINFLPGEESKPENLTQNNKKNTAKTISFKINPETEFRLRKFKQKIEKKKKEKISFDQLIQTILDQVEEQENTTKKTRKKPKNSTPNQIKNQQKNTNTEKQTARQGERNTTTTTRPIKAQKRRNLDKEFKGKCGHPGCNKPATHFHHTKRFAHHKTHEYIVPLCKEHHDLAHAGLIENEQKIPSTWKTREEAQWDNIIDYQIDKKVFREKQRYR